MSIPLFVVSRKKLARSPLATGPGPAWTFLYDVSRNGVLVMSGASRLDSVRSWIGRKAHSEGDSRFAVQYQWEKEKGFRPAQYSVNQLPQESAT